MKKLITGLFITAILIIATMAYSLSQDNIENLIVCSANKEASYIPCKICEYYLINFRGSKADIDFLSKGAGLGFLVNIDNKQLRIKLFEFFLSKGMDINARSNIDGLTPLHAAILINDHELVNYLLMKGADKNITDRDKKLTANAFLDLLNQKRSDIDRKIVQQLLSKEAIRALTP